MTSLHLAFSTDYIVQDDVRIHLVWLERFIDKNLFPDDIIADYYITIMTPGVKAVYWFLAQMGIKPLVAVKFIPVFLGLISTFYLFYFCLEVMPNPVIAFIIQLVFNQLLWLNDSIISGTSRGFLYPIFAAFLYYLAKGDVWLCLLSVALQGLFYPQILMVQMGVLTLSLIEWDKLRPRFSQEKKAYGLWVGGLVISGLIVSFFSRQIVASYGNIITPSEMRLMPEFGYGGRDPFFGTNPFWFLFNNSSGLGLPLFPTIVWSSLGLPFILKSRLPLVPLVTKKSKIILDITLASLGMFCFAYIFLFKLHFPSRYTYHSLRFVMAIGTGIVLSCLCHGGWCWWQKKLQLKQKINWWQTLATCGVMFSLTIVVVFPAIPSFVWWAFQAQIVGEYPALYEFLATTPPNTMVVSLSGETDNIPAFTRRSVLFSRETSLAYHLSYYRHIQERVVATINAQYATDLAVTKNFIDRYKINYLILENNFISPDYLVSKPWLINSSWQNVVKNTTVRLEKQEKLAITDLIEPCRLLSNRDLIILDGACIKKF